MHSRPGTFLIYVNTASMPNLKRPSQGPLRVKMRNPLSEDMFSALPQ